MTVEARLTVANSAGEALATDTASDTATVTVEKELDLDPSEYGDVGGSGSLTVEVG